MSQIPLQNLTAFPFTSNVTYDSAGWPTLDRAVDSSVIRNMIKKFFSDGIFLSANANAFEVNSLDDSRYVRVSESDSAVLIQGVTGYAGSSGSMDVYLEDADADLPRYDMITLYLDDSTRRISLGYKIGTAAEDPAYPTLIREDGIWELGIAALYRPAGSTVITQSQITDLRADSTYCGQVNAIDAIDTSEWGAQLEAYTAEQQAEFTAWFDEMKDQLSEDAAGNLQNEIDNLASGDIADTSNGYDGCFGSHSVYEALRYLGGIWLQGSALAGATSIVLTINVNDGTYPMYNDMNPVVDVYSENTSNTPLAINSVETELIVPIEPYSNPSTLQVTVTFDALEEDTSFLVNVREIYIVS